MLNKDVCQACINAMAGKSVEDGRVERAVYDFATAHHPEPKFRGWDDDDDERYCNGIIKCRIVPMGSAKVTADAPPTWCKFRLEHIVSQG
jgi:hypothetical protein